MRICVNTFAKLFFDRSDIIKHVITNKIIINYYILKLFIIRYIINLVDVID